MQSSNVLWNSIYRWWHGDTGKPRVRMPAFRCKPSNPQASPEPNPSSWCRIRSESQPGLAKPIRIRTWPGKSDPNLSLSRRNRSESEPDPAKPIRREAAGRSLQGGGPASSHPTYWVGGQHHPGLGSKSRVGDQHHPGRATTQDLRIEPATQGFDLSCCEEGSRPKFGEGRRVVAKFTCHSQTGVATTPHVTKTAVKYSTDLRAQIKQQCCVFGGCIAPRDEGATHFLL